ncbi:MAG: alanine--tRNA ligase [Candidatus Omnitrophota bacterium]
MDCDTLREKFLSFFAKQNHKIMPSDSLIPAADPTVLFTSAGMNQFKKQFLGIDIANSRVATCQKCLRTDDLDKVGKTAAHHTFFEMLGNFSFGDYFKKEAIELAWQFLTGDLGIDKNNLWVSVHDSDDESFDIWLKNIGIDKKRIIKLGDKENFWPSEAKSKGPNGPCGPCSEIFFDLGETLGCGKPDCSPACTCGRFVEVWNLVFTQFERCDDGNLYPLPRKNIDTGMGLERLLAVMQGVDNNFKTDLFVPITTEISKLISRNSDREESAKEFRIKAIADHLRAICFAINDGVYPSNEDRGYVIRNLIRRASLFGKELSIEGPFLYRLVDILAEVMQRPYPEIKNQRENIAQIIQSEENRFISTLEIRLPEFVTAVKEFSSKGISKVPAELLFRFYDTFGLPWELMESEAAKLNISCEKEEFGRLLDKQRRRSRETSKLSSSIFVKLYDFKREDIEFVDSNSIRAKVIAIFKEEPQEKKKSLMTKASGGMEVEIVLNKTNFYAEGGGQVGDRGVLENERVRIEITDTKLIEGAIIHIGKVIKGDIAVGDEVDASIDAERRLAIARNHTATHLLQTALRTTLGTNVRQQGSLVTDEYLRFDFSYPKQIKEDQLERIEDLVNDFILADDGISKKIVSLNEAKASGALAFFQDRYGDTVRMVSIGEYSKELCGGSHLNSTGQIGLFRIISESSIASGIRRIEACTGKFARSLQKQERSILESISRDLKISQENILPQLNALIQKIKSLERQLMASRLGLFKATLPQILSEAKVIGSVRVISTIIDNCDYEILRNMADLLKEKSKESIIVLGSEFNQRGLLLVSLTADLVKRGFSAAKLIQPLTKMINGSGGGKPNLAQGSSDDTGQLKTVVGKAQEILKKELENENP